MQYTRLGRSGLKVSRLCLGTMNFGPITDEKEAFRIMDAALDAGINFFDTANHYGRSGHSGETEEIIGRWFSQGGGRRERVVLATKVYQPMDDPNDGPNNAGGLSGYKLRRHLEGSLRRLQTDHIELYQMHHIDRNVTWEELWGGFEFLIGQGKIGYAGSSNFAGWHLAQAQAAAKERRFLGLISEQHKYNLMCRLPELEILPSARHFGIGILPWSPLAGGLLGGFALQARQGARSQEQQKKIEQVRAQLEAFHALCNELEEDPANIALAWLLSNPAVTSPVIGPRNLEQFQNALRVIDITLDDTVLNRLDEIFPGPGGKAPEAYAW